MKHYIFWQDALSIHQSALLRNLAAMPGIKVTLLIWEEINRERKNAGWPEPDLGKTQVIVKPSSAMQAQLLLEDAEDAAHVFSGPHGHPFVSAALRRGLTSNSYVGILSEAHDGRGLKGRLRLLRSALDARQIGGRVNSILAIGRVGASWFAQSGFPAEKIYPFAYFVETPMPAPDILNPQHDCGIAFNLVFVGQLIPRKRWDILLHALNNLGLSNWRLHVVGDGIDRQVFLQTCVKLGLAPAVCFHGIQSNKATIDLIAQSDLLVLPSDFDGWGAVVNEALMCGIPVVCTDQCGAKDLLDGGLRGEVTPAGSVRALRNALYRRIADGKKNPEITDRIRQWARCIDGASAAQYFLAVIDASLRRECGPTPPWFCKRM
jgi:glycosyltransferase involved in cell wall biosynthesis